MRLECPHCHHGIDVVLRSQACLRIRGTQLTAQPVQLELRLRADDKPAPRFA